jgi:hypothetical protein
MARARFNHPNCYIDYIKIAMEKIDIEYNETIAFDSEQSQKAVCVGYVNPQEIAKWQLFRE